MILSDLAVSATELGLMALIISLILLYYTYFISQRWNMADSVDIFCLQRALN